MTGPPGAGARVRASRRVYQGKVLSLDVDERMHVFRATGLVAVPPRPEEDEHIEVRSFTLDEARDMIKRGELREGKTMVAILLEAEGRSGGAP